MSGRGGGRWRVTAFDCMSLAGGGVVLCETRWRAWAWLRARLTALRSPVRWALTERVGLPVEMEEFLDSVADCCCVCGRETRYWYRAKDVALCRSCAVAATHYGIPTKWEWFVDALGPELWRRKA